MAELFYEGREHFLDLLRLVCEVSVLVWVQVTEVVGKEQVVLQFARRTHRNEEVAAEFGGAALSAALGYVGWYGSGATTKLAPQPIPFVRRKPNGSLVDTQGKPMPLAPDLKLPKISHHQVVGSSVSPL